MDAVAFALTAGLKFRNRFPLPGPWPDRDAVGDRAAEQVMQRTDLRSGADGLIGVVEKHHVEVHRYASCHPFVHPETGGREATTHLRLN